MAYERVNWENSPSTATPLNATNLNKMDAGIANLDEGVAALNAKFGGDGILDISKGGTGNSEGYIQTGYKALSVRGTKVTIEGENNVASANYCHAEGSNNTASRNNAHVEGRYNTASGTSSHAQGESNTASGNYSHAGGEGNVAGYSAQTVVGKYNNNKSDTLFEVGNGTSDDDRKNAFEISGDGISTDDGNTKIRFGNNGLGQYGYYKGSDNNLKLFDYTADTGIDVTNNVIRNTMPQLGDNASLKNIDSVTQGQLGMFGGNVKYMLMHFDTDAEPYNDEYTLMLTYSGSVAIMKSAVLYDRVMGMPYSNKIYAETTLLCEVTTDGTGTEADPIHVDVLGTIDGYVTAGWGRQSALGERATAEGTGTEASGNYAHAHGYQTTASGNQSTAMGYNTTASADGATAMGNGATASGANSIAGGYNATASGAVSTAIGTNTQATQQAQVAMGKYNKANNDALVMVGNGTSGSARSNALEVLLNGDVKAGNDIIDGQGNNLASVGTVVNAAYKLISNTPVAESVPYLYRRSGGVVRDVALENLKKVIGASVAWNQFVRNGNFSNGTTYWSITGATATAANNEYKVILTSDRGIPYNTQSFDLSHVYISSCEVRSNKNQSNESMFAFGGVATSNKMFFYPTTSYQKLSLVSVPTKASDTVYFQLVGASGDEFYVKNVILTDLTQALGSTIANYILSLEQATAGSGVAKLKEWGFFTKDYYAYNTGALQSVKTSGKKCVGKNLLKRIGNTVTKYGVTLTFNDDGTITANGTSTDYVWLTTAYIGGQSYNLDKSKNYILSGCPSGFGSNGGLQLRDLSTGQNNALYIGTGSGKQFINDNGSGFTIDADNIYDDSGKAIDINASTTVIGLRINPNVTVNNLVFGPMLRLADVSDADYEPYVEKTYPLSNIELRGLFKLDSNNNLYADGDEYTPDGNIKRKYGIVNLGSLDWSYVDSTNHIFRATLDTMASVASSADRNKGVMGGKYPPSTTTSIDSSMSDKSVLRSSDSSHKYVFIRDTSYSDATTFTTAVNGVYLIYELATATTETTTPYSETMPVESDGTEEFIDTRDVPVPVGHYSEYSQKIAVLPTSPTTDGTYKLICTVSNGVPTFSWAAN